ncbi:MAG: hypothetical protein WEE64_09060 [Dehalococcoidia bacterium]
MRIVLGLEDARAFLQRSPQSLATNPLLSRLGYKGRSLPFADHLVDG